MAPKPRKVEPGDRFGYWTVVEELDPIPLGERKRRMMRVVCDCGAEHKVLLQKLSTGQSLTCRECFYARRRCTFITHNDLTLSVMEWSRKLGIRHGDIIYRRNRGYPTDIVLHPGPIAELRKAKAA